MVTLYVLKGIKRYVAAVSAQYDETESEAVEYEFTFSIDAPQNLAVTELG